jgi:hypothetical protein
VEYIIFVFLFSHVFDIFNAFLQLFFHHTYCSFPMVVSQMVDRGVIVSAQTLVSSWNATVMFALVYNCAISNVVPITFSVHLWQADTAVNFVVVFRVVKVTPRCIG